MKVLVIDPGERCGWAHGVIESPRAGVHPVSLKVTGHGIAFLKDMALKLHEVAGNYDAIVYEDYRIAANKVKAHVGSNVPTLQMIGMIRLCAWLNPTVKLVTQYPKNQATADRSMPDWLRDKIAALPKAHDDSHDGSALKHLWHFYFMNYV